MLSKSVKQTHKIAKNLAKKITSMSDIEVGVVVALTGDLGSGKTTFTQGLAKALGVKEKITSPTFVILKRFKIKNSRFKNLIHIDAYRIEKPEEILDLGWKNFTADPGNIVLIEWAERVEKIFKKPYFLIKFGHKTEKQRRIDICIRK